MAYPQHMDLFVRCIKKYPANFQKKLTTASDSSGFSLLQNLRNKGIGRL